MYDKENWIVTSCDTNGEDKCIKDFVVKHKVGDSLEDPDILGRIRY